MPATIMPAKQRRAADRKGGVMVETALVLPIILVMVMGLFDHCRAIMVQQLVINAAREGARQAIANTSTMTTANLQAVVTQALAGQRFSSVAISVYQVDPVTGNNLGAWNSTPAGSSIAVQVNAHYTPMLSPFSLLPSSMAIEATSIMTSEAN
jgi:Flp pilus assembly protein TadG